MIGMEILCVKLNNWSKKGGKIMAVVNLDCMGLKCPQPVLRIAAKSAELKPGDVLEVIADCPTFEKDIKQWCERTKKTLLWLREEGEGKKRCQIQF